MNREPDASSDPGKQKTGISIGSILGLSLFLGLITGAGAGVSLILPVTLISAIILYFKRDKIAAATETGKSAHHTGKPAHDLYAWPELGHFSCAVAARPYQNAIQQLAQENGIDLENGSTTQSQVFKAHLIPDNSNPYDTDFVRININNRAVGYLDHRLARSFLDQLEEKGLSEQVTVCSAILTRNYEADGNKTRYGVRLDIELIG
ncbi:MAG: hypothetical protein HRU78_04955 [Gammaproteobacteria bacterium]|nr:MAG: hypothetical protein HRU78_04955 [Gammaproteobacteria bacterium]